MSEYVVKNWTRFQHYKNRNPPWIKLHFELLASADWVMLDDSSRVLAVACMLIASRSEGRIDCSKHGLAYLQRVAYLNKPPNVKPLIECGFLEPASECKQVLADARPEEETETEEETEGEGEGAQARARKRKRAKQIPPNFEVTEDMRCWAKEKHGLVNGVVDSETEKFRDHHTAKGSTFVDWTAAWRTWIARATQYGSNGQRGPGVPRKTKFEQIFGSDDG